jgi:hypothetical protein
MSKWIGIATLAGATCLMVGSALAQSQTPPSPDAVRRVVDIKALIGPRAGRAFPQAPRERSVQGLRAVGGRRAPEHFDSDLAPPGTAARFVPEEDLHPHFYSD